MFKEHGRWKHEDDAIYSEIELKYLYSSLTSMVDENDPNSAEFEQTEGLAIINKHWVKTVNTLQKLMNTMNMMYYFQKLKILYDECDKPGKRPSIGLLEKTMNRCFKLYQMIDDFMKIFKLIQVREVSTFNHLLTHVNRD